MARYKPARCQHAESAEEGAVGESQCMCGEGTADGVFTFSEPGAALAEPLVVPSGRLCARWQRPATLCGLGLLCVAVASGWSRGTGGYAAKSGVLDTLDEFGLFKTPHFSIVKTCMAAYTQLLKANDPFKFKCPLPLTIRGFTPNGGEDLTPRASCCQGYRNILWPYQFPQCKGVTHCESCSKATGQADLAQHPAAKFAGASWAAIVTTKGHARLPQSMAAKFKLQVSRIFSQTKVVGEKVKGNRMLAIVGAGVSKHTVDVCPTVDDWEMSMAKDDDHNLHVRVFKSSSAKLAVVAFRGTQAWSVKNWEVDANIKRVAMDLGSEGPSTYVHAGFYAALERVLPVVKKWVTGYMMDLNSKVPDTWKLVFTGHSLGGALAVLAATVAEAEGWSRKPDAVIAWGAPRIADRGLDSWWRSRGLCHKLLRINVYNDVIHWFPFKKFWNWWRIIKDMLHCASPLNNCDKDTPAKMLLTDEHAVAFDDSAGWMHVCEDSEVVLPGAMEGVNEQLQEFSPFGGLLSHFVSNCLFGYSYGVMHGSSIARDDAYCNIGPSMCPGYA